MSTKSIQELDAALDSLRVGQAALVAKSGHLEDALKSGGSWRGGTGENRAALEQAGRLFKAMATKDTATLGQLQLQTKADLGTPLYSDTGVGAYLVPVEFHREVIRIMTETSIMYPLVQRIPMLSRTKSLVTQTTGATLVWIAAQSTDLTETLPQFGSKTLTAYALAAWLGIHEDSLSDSAPDMGRFFATIFGEDFANEIDNQILNGSGTPWSGLLVDSSVTAVTTMAAGKTAFTDIDADDIMSMIESLPYAKYRRGAIFVFAPTVIDALRKQKDANGRFLIQEMGAGNPVSLFGYRVYSCDSAPTVSAAATAFGYFGNPKYFILGERKALEVEMFDKTGYRVSSGEIFFRAYARYAGSVALPEAVARIKTAAS